MKFLLWSVVIAFCVIPKKVPSETLIPVLPSSDGQHLVKHCLRGNAGIWKTDEVLSYCLSLVTPQ